MFSSPYSIYIVSAVTSCILVWFCTKQFPLTVVWRFAKDVFQTPWIWLHFILMFFVLFFNKMELSWENKHPRSYDVTPFIYGIEGDMVKWIQTTFEFYPLTYVLTFFYVIFMTAMLFTLLITFRTIGDNRSFKALFYAISLNYLIAIPFYMFVPVNEVWASGHGVSFLIPQIYPGFEDQYRALSGLNNCFPSVHTSLSVTLLLVSLRSTSKKAIYLSALNAVMVIFGIFYLGIHWITDSIGGIFLALLASHVAFKIADKTKWGRDET